ncbi:MAG: class I SAM-dependent methyltransferase [Chitinophagaceae bacterium]|nr:class I SAM-dependent methyltransferase [Chitinophagaceae bacterium]
MKNRDQWTPSKYVFTKRKLKASRNPKEVMISSRLSADMIAACYQKHIPLHVTGRLLDLGCGKVPLFETYKNYITENICVDWGNSLHKNPYLDFEADLNNEINLPGESFDTVILSDVLEHIRYPEKLMKEINRLLKPHGKLLMSVPFFYWLHEQPYDYFRYTRHALETITKDAGLTIVSLEEYGGAPEVFTDIFAKTIVSLRSIGKPIASAAQGFTSAFVSTRIGRRYSAKTRSKFPLGYFLIAQRV